jgi:hypothetical protein
MKKRFPDTTRIPVVARVGRKDRRKASGSLGIRGPAGQTGHRRLPLEFFTGLGRPALHETVQPLEPYLGTAQVLVSYQQQRNSCLYRPAWREMSLMSAIPYPNCSRAEFEKAE